MEYNTERAAEEQDVGSIPRRAREVKLICGQKDRRDSK